MKIIKFEIVVEDYLKDNQVQKLAVFLTRAVTEVGYPDIKKVSCDISDENENPIKDLTRTMNNGFIE